jgi:hypothetical protein
MSEPGFDGNPRIRNSVKVHVTPQIEVSEPFCGMNALRPRKRRLNAEARRALGLLAVDRRGTAEALMLAGFTHRMLARLVHAGLATWYRGAVKADDRTIEVTYLMITDAGWRAIEGGEPRGTYLGEIADSREQLAHSPCVSGD